MSSKNKNQQADLNNTVQQNQQNAKNAQTAGQNMNQQTKKNSGK